MKTDRWKQIDELFDAVIELSPDKREKFLSESCDGDEELRNEVLSLLEAHEKACGFMESPAMDVAAKNIAQEKTFIEDTLFVGREIGAYKIEKLLGTGGMGEVYLAQDKKLNRKVALKILPSEFLKDNDRIKRFELEARAISVLNHPNIVTIYDFGNHESVNYIATELVNGKTVRELIGAKPTLKEILSIITQSCEALSAAHNAGIIHRDIKPENIMVRPDGYVKILDFGLAKLTETEESIKGDFAKTMKGVVIGTPAYMSPEQVSDDKVDHRTDLWSIGVVLYELLTGKNPFKGANRQETFQAILFKEPPLASSLNPVIPAELDQILIKALEKDPDLSYQTASDFRSDLKRLIRTIDSGATFSGEKSAAITKQNRTATKTVLLKRSYAVLISIAAVLVLISFLAFFIWKPFEESDAPDWTKATNTQLTDKAGTEYYPSLSPDGKSFVYAAETNGKLDIFLQRIGGKNPQPLTEDSPEDDTQPAFSPNGEHIAFRSEREPSGIYVMGATGENAHRVCDFGFHPSWSPNGKELAITELGRDVPSVRGNITPSALWRVNIETGEKRELIRNEAVQPAWSPNGKRIAFWFMPAGAGRRDIATIPADGGEPVVITKDAVTNWNPMWSPDGKYLYFASDKSGNMNFWRVRIDETTGKALSEPEAVVIPSQFSRHLNFSRDGKNMIYVSTDNKANIQAVEFDAKNEKVIGQPFWITSGDREVTRAELSPDGTKFLMRMIRRTQDDVVVVNRDGTNWRDITNDAPFDRYPRWSPDGKQIAFTSDRNGIYQLFTVNADGTNLKQLTYADDPGASFPIWSPDGKRMAYTTRGVSFVFELTKDWKEQTPFRLPPLDDRSRFVVWDWSPDGKKLFGTFNGNPRSAGYYVLETKQYERVVDVPDVAIPSCLFDSRRFVFASEDKIFIADIETKKARELMKFSPDQARSPFVSRDGRLLYYTVHSSESDIWILSLE